MIDKSQIPKIIHHIAPKDRNKWVPIWNSCYDSWLENFNNHEHLMWDNDNLRDFVSSFFQEHLKFYDKLPWDVMRYDFGRLLLLKHYGGIYADMDMFCYKNFESFLDEELKTVSVDNYSKSKCFDGSKAVIESCLIFSLPNNNFFDECIEIVINRVNVFANHFDNRPNTIFVPYCSGPYAFQQAFFNYYNNLKFLFPWQYFSRDPKYYGEELYTRHMNTTSWTKWTTADNRNWISDPEKFSFYKNDNLEISYR